MTPAQKEEALTELYKQWAACTRCKLHDPQGRARKNVVFGEGNPHAPLMVVGEAPGEEEDKTGQPFSGPSGSVIDGFLESLSAKREEIFIVNIVGCRPTELENPKKNRAPEDDEIRACFPRLQQIIEIVDPFVILMLGDVAYKTLSSDKGTVTKHARNKFLDQIAVVTMGQTLPVTRTGYVTFHPSYLLRNWSTDADSDVHWSYRMWERAFQVADMNAFLHRGTPIPNRR